MRVALVTCAAYPDLTESDALLADALRRRNHRVVALPWNGETGRPELTDVAVLRSNWDYHDDLDRFLAWLVDVELAGTRVLNDPELVRWNFDKRYLVELAAKGIAVPRMVDAPTSVESLESWFAETGCSTAVRKPAWGASGHLVDILRAGESRSTDVLGVEAQDGRPFLVQEFVDSISDGEHALVFFAGLLSHSFIRLPSPREFRVNSQYGGRVEATTAAPELVHFAQRVLEALPSRPTYARVDVVATAAGPVLMEVELNEPSLCLNLAEDSADRFATAICDVAQ
ncbi:MAG: hypothetical protein GY708_08050 [Actinomycetia bacterium]|nr:hypothetical protein [Actinomycetes bacterium]